MKQIILSGYFKGTQLKRVPLLFLEIGGEIEKILKAHQAWQFLLRTDRGQGRDATISLWGLFGPQKQPIQGLLTTR